MSSGSASACSSGSMGAYVACYCGERSIVLSSWKARSFGRRFRGCAKYWMGGSCNFFEWVDPPTCEYGLDFGKKVLRRLEKLEHQLETLQGNHNERVNKLEAHLQVVEETRKGVQSINEHLTRKEKIWRRVSCVSWMLTLAMVIFYLLYGKGNMYRMGYLCIGDGYGWFM